MATLSGFGAIPPKLFQKIIAGKYVNIWELLPETWQIGNESSYCHSKRPCRSLVTDINIWTECYATLAAIQSSAFPQKAPHFFFLRTITKDSRTFENTTWASYDMAYRRQAAVIADCWTWGIIDAALNNEAFTSQKAKWDGSSSQQFSAGSVGVWRYVGSTMPYQAAAASTRTVSMHTCALNANVHTLLLSVWERRDRPASQDPSPMDNLTHHQQWHDKRTSVYRANRAEDEQ